MNSLKILFCTDGIFPHAIGGMQRHSRLLLQELANNTAVEIVVVHPHEQDIFTAHKNITEIHVKGIDKDKNYLIECYKYSQRVYNVILKHPDYIVYSQGLSVWYKTAAIKNTVIVNPHGLEPFQAIGLKAKLTAIPFKIIFKYLFKHADYVISLGGKLTAILENNISDKNKIVVLPNAVNLPENIAIKNFTQELKFLFVGRFEENKGIFYLLEAIKELNNSHIQNNYSFTFAGKGPLYSKCLKNYAHLHNVNFLGFVHDRELTELYKTCHIFILPTLYEGMPTAVMEAMSYGMPVIVTDVGATSELVDADNGFLIKAADKSALADAIKKMMNMSNTQLQQMALASLKKIKDKYTWTAVAQQHIELFYKLLTKSL